VRALAVRSLEVRGRFSVSRRIRSSRAKSISLLAAGALAVALNVASGTAAFAHEGRFVEREHSRFVEHEYSRFIERGGRDFDDCGCEDERFRGRFEHRRFERFEHGRFHGRDLDDCLCEEGGFELPFFPVGGRGLHLEDDAIANLHMGAFDRHIGI